MYNTYLDRWPGKVARFNKLHPVGSPVSICQWNGHFATKVAAPAVVMSNHLPVVWLEGVEGYYPFDKIIVN